METIYKEGISVEVAPCRYSKQNATMIFRFHLRQLSYLQLNVFEYFFNRAYADIAGLCVTSKAHAEVRINVSSKTHWSNMNLSFSIEPEDMDNCYEYLEKKFPDTYTKLSRCSKRPVSFVVEFQVVDSCIGIPKTVGSIRASNCLEMYGFSGKSKNTPSTNTDISGDDLYSIVNAEENNELETISNGFALPEENDDDKSINDIFFNNTSRNTKDNSTNKKKFVNDGKEAVFDIMDPLVLLTPAKRQENTKLMSQMVTFLNSMIDENEDGFERTQTSFIGFDQYMCFERFLQLGHFLLVSSPVNVYRIATSLFVNMVCFRLRSNTKKIKQIPSSPNTFEYGSETQIVPMTYTNCRFKLDSSNCKCGGTCNIDTWADTIREKNAREILGKSFSRDEPKKRHNAHKIIPHDFVWFDKLERDIVNIASDASGKKFKPRVPVSTRCDSLSTDRNALDVSVKCYPYVAHFLL